MVRARWSDRPLSKVLEEKEDEGRVVNMLSIKVVECDVIRVGVDIVSCRLCEWRRSRNLAVVLEV